MNTIIWSKTALKQRRKIERVQLIKIDAAVDALVDFRDNPNVKALKNHRFDYRLRVGRFRVLFNHDDALKIVAIEEVKKRDEHTY